MAKPHKAGSGPHLETTAQQLLRQPHPQVPCAGRRHVQLLQSGLVLIPQLRMLALPQQGSELGEPSCQDCQRQLLMLDSVGRCCHTRGKQRLPAPGPVHPLVRGGRWTADPELQQIEALQRDQRHHMRW